MLTLGLGCTTAGVFLLWVMFHGQEYITPDDAKDWGRSWADVAKAAGGWLNPNVSAPANGSGTMNGTGGNF